MTLVTVYFVAVVLTVSTVVLVTVLALSFGDFFDDFLAGVFDLAMAMLPDGGAARLTWTSNRPQSKIAFGALA